MTIEERLLAAYAYTDYFDEMLKGNGGAMLDPTERRRVAGARAEELGAHLAARGLTVCEKGIGSADTLCVGCEGKPAPENDPCAEVERLRAKLWYAVGLFRLRVEHEVADDLELALTEKRMGEDLKFLQETGSEISRRDRRIAALEASLRDCLHLLDTAEGLVVTDRPEYMFAQSGPQVMRAQHGTYWLQTFRGYRGCEKGEGVDCNMQLNLATLSRLPRTIF